MDMGKIKDAFERSQKVLTLRPSRGRATGTTTVRVREGLICDIDSGPWRLVADMPVGAGGTATAPTPGTLGRAALGSCLAIGYIMRAAASDLPITSLTVEIPNEAPLRIERDGSEGGKHKLVSIPQGKKLKQGADVDAVVRAVAGIELDDVRKLDEAASGEVGTARFEADGGLEVTLRLRKQGEDTWVSIAATAKGDGDGKKAAETITNRTKGWEFKIPASKATAILKRPDDLFEAS